jgi:hypothetical protein
LRQIGIHIFFAGIALSVCAFLVDRAENIPVVMRLLAPAYIHAQTGLAKLQSTKTLVPGDEGFPEISRLFFETASHENTPELLATLSIKSFTRQTAMIALGDDRAGEVIPLQVDLPNGQTVRWDAKQVEAQLSTLKQARIFDYTLAFFGAGTAIEILGFLIERRGSHARSKA